MTAAFQCLALLCPPSATSSRLQPHTGSAGLGSRLLPAAIPGAGSTEELFCHFPRPPDPPRHSQEEILHDVVIICQVAVREVAGSKHDDGVETFPVISWKKIEGTLQGHGGHGGHCRDTGDTGDSLQRHRGH